MKEIIGYIKGYFYETDKRILFIITPFTGFLIWLNYHFGLDDWIGAQNSFGTSLLARTLIFLVAFGVPYLLYAVMQKQKYFTEPRFLFLLVVAPLIFSFKIAYDPVFYISDDPFLHNFWNHVFYWPVLLLIVTAMLMIIHKRFDADQPFYGFKTKKMNWRPYIIMLLIMLPLIAAASTQPDFQAVYPKLKLISDIGSIDRLKWWEKLLFELSYGSDFISVELFFRGFLILAFIKWAGKNAILPMACFYCTIHFGKPLGECISSYFGGMILGIVVYHTRSILGGLMVHLGIAWLMEAGGYIGNIKW